MTRPETTSSPCPRGKRYEVVPDEVLTYAHGFYGKPVAPLDQDVLDRIMATPKATNYRDWDPP